MYQVSVYEMATFTDGKWYCGCGVPAKWLTSKQDNTKGQKLVRCPNNGDEECRFFLWEKDEAAIRAAKASETPRSPLPQTPPSNRHPLMMGRPDTSSLPTPNSRGDNTRRIIFQLPNNTSPTPQRYRDSPVTSGDREADLFSEVVTLLKRDNIVLKSFTEVQLRHIINMRVELYETKMRMYQETFAELNKKLTEAESSGP